MRPGITATQKQRTCHRGILFLFQVNYVNAAKLDVPIVPAGLDVYGSRTRDFIRGAGSWLEMRRLEIRREYR